MCLENRHEAQAKPGPSLSLRFIAFGDSRNRRGRLERQVSDRPVGSVMSHSPIHGPILSSCILLVASFTDRYYSSAQWPRVDCDVGPGHLPVSVRAPLFTGDVLP